MLAGLLLVPMLAFGVATTFSTQPVGAADLTLQDGANAAKGTSSTTCLFTNTTDCVSGVFNTVVNIMLFIIGAISVIMLIYGGIRYTVSGGNTANVTAAKNTILYAIVGLIVAALAYAIVNFVIVHLIQS